ncbi:Putative lipoprotein [hydrothermal vent metagenome]|uniref:Lipoprotein n=1 Tax=hydrothermal vent metagenome TaxID=652676 RepID=A0A3B1E7I5_9ZZZZ
MFKIFLYSYSILILFVGCSSKQYFEPKQDTKQYSGQSKSIEYYIKQSNKNGATLFNYKIITDDGISNYSLPKGYHLLNKTKDTIIASNNTKRLLLKSRDKETILLFTKNIISATLHDNLLALIFENNSLGVFDISLQKFKLKEYQQVSILNDHRIASPIFLTNIILFPTLNGTVVIVDNQNFRIIKTITIDPASQINNIIFLKTIDDTMLVATPNKIFTLYNDNVYKKEYKIKDIIINNKYLFVATLNGEIIKLDLSLNELVKRKFKFAKIHLLGFGTKLYALESNGFLISLNDDFSTINIFKFPFDNSKKTVYLNNRLYFDNKYIELK